MELHDSDVLIPSDQIRPLHLIVGPAFLGLLSHALWFIHGEHDFLSRIYVVLWGGIQATLLFVFARIFRESYVQAFTSTVLVSASYLVSLFTSIVIYRLFFHRLRHFPGPLSWRVTKFSQMWQNLDSLGYKHLDDLHKQYGNFVRTGPTEISVVDPEAPNLILGPGSKCYKAIWYDIQKPLVAMHTIRDKKLHDIRRRIWDKGFNAKALRNYESRVTKYTDLLMQRLKETGGGSFNATKWFNYYSFDVMGDLAFGEPFHMLETGESHFAMELLKGGTEPMNIMPAVPWVFYLLSKIPYLTKDFHNFVAWCGEQIQKRKTMKMTEPDIMSYLVDAPPMSEDPFINERWETGDSRLAIVAGSDTTAASISFCAYELITHPNTLAALRKEVESATHSDSVDYAALQNCNLLNAVIDEVLRLHPPVPSGLIRVTPREGLTINNTFIPGDTIVILPMYSLQRSAEAYEQPDEFIPERWTTRPELVKKKGAWAPFSLGPMGCVGKQLAYMEIRAVIAELITNFDIGFADNEDGSSLINKTTDHFTLHLGDMFVKCKPRK